MSAIPGSVRVGGFIAPTDSTDIYAVTDPIYGRGSLRSVADIAERNAITENRRALGMEVVLTAAPFNKYRLINEPGTPGTTDSDWENITQLIELNPAQRFVSPAGDDNNNGQIDRKKLTIENALTSMDGQSSADVDCEDGTYPEALIFGTTRSRRTIRGTKGSDRVVIDRTWTFNENCQQSVLTDLKFDNSTGYCIDVDSTLSNFKFDGINIGGSVTDPVCIRVRSGGSGFITIVNGDFAGKIIQLDNTATPRYLYLNRSVNAFINAGTGWIVIRAIDCQNIFEISSNNNILAGWMANSVLTNSAEYAAVVALGDAGNGYYLCNYTEAGVFSTGDVILRLNPATIVDHKYYNANVVYYVISTLKSYFKKSGTWEEISDALWNRITLAGNQFVQPSTSSDGITTDGDIVNSYIFTKAIVMGNDGIYHGTGDYSTLYMYDGAASPTLKNALYTDGTPSYITDALGLKGGIWDNNISSLTPIPFSDAGNASLNTTAQNYNGAINELNALKFTNATKCVFASSITGNDSNSGLIPSLPKATLAAAMTVAKTMSPSVTARVAIICQDNSVFTASSGTGTLIFDANTVYIDYFGPYSTITYVGNGASILFYSATPYNPNNTIVCDHVYHPISGGSTWNDGIYFDITGATTASYVRLYINRINADRYGICPYHGVFTIQGHVGYCYGVTTAINNNSGANKFELTIDDMAANSNFNTGGGGGEATGAFTHGGTGTATLIPTAMKSNNLSSLVSAGAYIGSVTNTGDTYTINANFQNPYYIVRVSIASTPTWYRLARYMLSTNLPNTIMVDIVSTTDATADRLSKVSFSSNGNASGTLLSNCYRVEEGSVDSLRPIIRIDRVSATTNDLFAKLPVGIHIIKIHRVAEGNPVMNDSYKWDPSVNNQGTGTDPVDSGTILYDITDTAVADHKIYTQETVSYTTDIWGSPAPIIYASLSVDNNVVTLTLTGAIGTNASGTADVIDLGIIIPSIYAPLDIQYFPAILQQGASVFNIGRVQVFTNGRVTIANLDAGDITNTSGESAGMLNTSISYVIVN